jgi:hypothetical protein
MAEEIRNKIERFKIKAERFLVQDKRVFIVDTNNSYYFCDIIFVGEEGIHVQSFAGNLKNTKSNIYWEDILRIEEYRERGG